MDQSFVHFSDLSREVALPKDGTLSRTLFQDAKLKVVLFGFAAGQELSEHTASTPAVLHFISGEAAVTLGADVKEVGPGGWIHMAAGLPHSIHAKTPVVMLLSLIRCSGQ